MMGGTSTFIPLKVNMAGVIPVIFASSMMMIIPTFTQFFGTGGIAGWFTVHLGPSSFAFIILQAGLIVVFTYFYTAVTFNPIDQAENLKKYGGFIPGVRPGRPTAEFLDRILTRLTFPGALFLAALAVLAVAHVGGLERAVLLRRCIAADRRGRGARHHAPDGGATAHASLRRLPEIGGTDGRIAT